MASCVDVVEQAATCGTAARQAALSSPLREVHRDVLRHFVATGRPPSHSRVGREAAVRGLEPAEALARLAAADLVHTEGGQVTVAYPFSGSRTRHRVRLDDGPELTAMCAIDALGIPQLVGRDGVIRSTDPHTGDPIRVEAAGGSWQWDPATTVVLHVCTSNCGRSCDRTCPYIGFHTAAASAMAYLGDHPEVIGDVLDQPTAVEAAGLLFGPLLMG